MSNNSEQSVDTSKMNIYQKMLRISAEIGTVSKSLDVSLGGNKSYKAVAERDILNAVKPLEEKYGVFSYPRERVVLESQIYETEQQYGNNPPTKKTSFMMRIMTIYRFVNTDNPDEYIETTTFAEGIDAQDKGSGKAMTYCDKYALLKAYKIATGDEADPNENNGIANDIPQNSMQYGGYNTQTPPPPEHPYYDQAPPPPPEPPYYRGQGSGTNRQQKQNATKAQSFGNKTTSPASTSQNGVGRWKGA